MAEEMEKDDGTVLDDNTAGKLLQEIKEGKREWDLDGIKYFTQFPTPAVQSEARYVYTKVFSKALRDDIPTVDEMDKLIKKRGVWTDEDEAANDGFRAEIVKYEALLAKKSPDDKSKVTRKYAEALAEARQSLMDNLGRHSSYTSQTVEQLAKEAQAAYIIASCTFTADGKRVWDTVDAFTSDTRAPLVNTATYEWQTFSNGVAEDYVDMLPEVQFLSEGKTDGGAE